MVILFFFENPEYRNLAYKEIVSRNFDNYSVLKQLNHFYFIFVTIASRCSTCSRLTINSENVVRFIHLIWCFYIIDSYTWHILYSLQRQSFGQPTSSNSDLILIYSYVKWKGSSAYTGRSLIAYKASGSTILQKIGTILKDVNMNFL